MIMKTMFILFVSEVIKIRSKEDIEEMICDIREILNNFHHLYETGQISKECLEVLTLDHKGELDALEWVLS